MKSPVTIFQNISPTTKFYHLVINCLLTKLYEWIKKCSFACINFSVFRFFFAWCHFIYSLFYENFLILFLAFLCKMFACISLLFGNLLKQSIFFIMHKKIKFLRQHFLLYSSFSSSHFLTKFCISMFFFSTSFFILIFFLVEDIKILKWVFEECQRWVEFLISLFILLIFLLTKLS